MCSTFLLANSSLLFFFLAQEQESDGAMAFKSAVADIDDVPIGITSSADIFREHNVDQDTVVLFKKVIRFGLGRFAFVSMVYIFT